MGKAVLTSTGNGVPKSVVVKCMPPGFGERLFTDGTGFFTKEVAFYERIGDSLDGVIRIPKLHHHQLGGCCGSKNSGVLVFEDLTLLDKAQFQEPWVPDGELVTTTATANAVVSQFAGLHAMFWGSSRFNKGGDLADFSVRGRGLNGGKSLETRQQHFFYNSGWKKYIAMTTDLPAGTDQALLSFGDSLIKDFPALYQLNFGTGPSTFIHGDAGLYNVMFFASPSCSSGGTDSMCVFDWQMCQQGKGIFDIAFFLCLSTPISMLEEHEAQFLDVYHAELTKKGVSGYSRAQLEIDYKVALVTTWAIIVYVAGLLAGKGPEWVAKIKLAAARTTAAVMRTGAVAVVVGLLPAIKKSGGYSTPTAAGVPETEMMVRDETAAPENV